MAGLDGVAGRAVRAVPAVRSGDPFPAALWLLRHGESQGNVAAHDAWVAGAQRLDLDLADADVPLTDRGRQQAAAVGRWLAQQPEDQRPEHVLTSPYLRAVQTAQGVLSGSGLDVPLLVDERLRERDLGIFDGLTGRGIRELHEEEAVRRRRLGKVWYRPPGGESWADVVLRVRSVVDTLLPRFAGERLLVVSHQAVVMGFRIVLEGLDPQDAVRIDTEDPQPNASLTRYAPAAQGAGDSGCALTAYADTTAVDASSTAVTEEPGADVPA